MPGTPRIRPLPRAARTSRAARIAAGLLAVAALAGCAGANAATPKTTATSAAADAPVTITNCGYRETIATAPKRVIAIKSTSTEMMLALGVGDRIVGTAFQDGPVASQWKADAAHLTPIADQMPSEEAVLERTPDLVYSGWESAFAADAAGTRKELTGLGVASYVQPAACRSTGAPAKLTFPEVFREIREAGRIFRVDSAPLIAQQKKTLAGIRKDDRGLSALWYSSGDDTPYVGGGTGAPELVLETAGLTNVAADVKQTWTSLGWESIVADDPDVIVLIDADWNTAAAKEKALAANPATAQLSAVKNKRYLVIPFAASEAGVRSVDAAKSLSEQLAKLDLP